MFFFVVKSCHEVTQFKIKIKTPNIVDRKFDVYFYCIWGRFLLLTNRTRFSFDMSPYNYMLVVNSKT